jgi:maleylacetoacetate isomerase
MTIKLYDYFRSSACYRVRIALNLKGLAYEAVETSLLAGDHQLASYKAMNPQGFVPLLDVDGLQLTQSVAIIEWLDAVHPEPKLIPADPNDRAHAMAITLTIACDIHPINNLRVLKRLSKIGVAETMRDDWYRHWISEGFAAIEAMAKPDQSFLGGERPGIADIMLVPQMANARRFQTPLDAFPKLVRIDADCCALDAFHRAHPDIVKPPVALADG